MAFITIRIAEQEGHERVSLAKDRLVVGRSTDCDIPIPHGSISREHCILLRKDGAWFVEDLGSANGTLVGVDRLHGSRTLLDHDIIRIGKVRLTFHLAELEQPAKRAPDQESAASRPSRPGDPAEAMRCTRCGIWLSIVHKSTGDRMKCANCSHKLTV